MVQTGSFSSVSLSQAAGLIPLSLAVANRLCIASRPFPGAFAEIPAMLDGITWLGACELISDRASDQLLSAIRRFIQLD